VDTLAGMAGVYFDGIFFSEALAAESQIEPTMLRVRLRRQNANLNEVKRELAAQVRTAGGNALVGFTYGQKSRLIGWDKLSWEGTGHVARL
jgi:hypothetical protein